jgi:F1F0 ATPase subunit 2
MSEATLVTLAGVSGVLLGGLFFGGLWWTIRMGLTSGRPAAWLLGSLVVRTAIALGGFYLAAGGDWRRLVACLAGFVLARIVLTRVAGAPIENRTPSLRGGGP